ncbi:MAG: hypothetical protein VYC34_12545, partial [Planctomycetota bacterium]|nr:hypothetical protein [Planctomycetota bacterium]
MRGSLWGVRRLAAVMMVVGASSAALGQGEQSLNDLRRENARLQERIAELESRLAQAQEVVKRLERQTADLREDLRKAQEAGRAGAGTSTSGG